MHATPAVPQELEKDLSSSEVTIRYLDGGTLKEVHESDPLDPLGGIRVELRPQIVVVRSEMDDDRCYHEQVVAAIPLESVVAIEVAEWGEEDVPYHDPTRPVARWFRGPNGQLLRFTA